ncbi:DUF6483 family protein [Extibacter muris]|uniref:DUF6483 family protein n=1 Tax=Extibacter muris TaxID=1796622 RepID=UPI001D06064E|nr:DUF6483 family protein [Extibacter muris]MCB6202458.1 DUF6483 family protein [Extibacter muris]MCQ4664917.1 DUF6483 family protein [Extibacter muris]MCQ4694282.1 DUF6483 family protein [Extibacter muris]
MDFEQDYIMRLVKDLVRFLMQLLTGKPQFRYEADIEQPSACGDDYTRIIAMADAGRINEAENLLYENLDRDNEDYLLMGLSFYSHVNDFDDDFLRESDYSRDEIRDGIESFIKEYGITGLEAFYSSALRLM